MVSEALEVQLNGALRRRKGTASKCANAVIGGEVRWSGVEMEVISYLSLPERHDSVATTLALVLLGLLMKVHTSPPHSTTCALGLTLWQLLSYCQEEIINVHCCLG